MPGLELHKPAARQVEHHHSQNPHDVNERQTMTISERPRSPDDRTVPDGLVARKGDQDCHDVNKINMEDVIKQWHSAIHQQNPAKTVFCFYAIKQRKQDE